MQRWCFFFLVLISISIASLGALEIKSFYINKMLATEHRGQVARAQVCFFALDSAVMELVQSNNLLIERTIHFRNDQCLFRLDEAGQSARTEEESQILGETRFFYNGYYDNVLEIIEIQKQLGALYQKGPDLVFDVPSIIKLYKLEKQQDDLIKETRIFIRHIELDLTRVWLSGKNRHSSPQY